MYAIIDIESTGGQYNEEGITEIAIYKYDGHDIVDQFASLINPEKPIDPYVIKLTGINNAMLKKAPKFYEVAKRIIEITTDCVMVAHNAEFDFRMLRQEFDRLGYAFEIKTLCTVELAQKLMPEQPSYSLGKLVRSLGIPITDRHRATGDALATVKLFQLLLQKDTSKTILSDTLKTIKVKTVDKRLKNLLDTITITTGVFCCYDKNDKVLFIGRGRNIKKALRKIITSSNKRLKSLTQEISRVTYEKTGNELLAQILEYNYVLENKPQYNRQPKTNKITHVITTNNDKENYTTLSIQPFKKAINYVIGFTSKRGATAYLQSLASLNELCLKHCNLDVEQLECTATDNNSCETTCNLNSEPQNYNEKIAVSINRFNINHPFMIITERGRTASEKMAIVIENKIIKGYCFTDLKIQLKDRTMLDKLLTPLEHNDHLRYIIQQHLRIKNTARLYTHID